MGWTCNPHRELRNACVIFKSETLQIMAYSLKETVVGSVQWVQLAHNRDKPVGCCVHAVLRFH
jgi:hypothetical protein